MLICLWFIYDRANDEKSVLMNTLFMVVETLISLKIASNI